MGVERYGIVDGDGGDREEEAHHHRIPKALCPRLFIISMGEKAMA
jgi:hypothetical protein